MDGMVSRAHICREYHELYSWGKNCHVEKFQLSMYDNCGEIENFFICSEILESFEKFWEILGNFATIKALSCGEKLSPKVNLWKKMTNMRSALAEQQCLSLIFETLFFKALCNVSVI